MTRRPDTDHDAVCESTARHLLVTAPPGTGKTHLTIRLAGELAPHLPGGSQVLALTFSNQARTQMEREAARQLSPGLRRPVEVSNYHSFFWRTVSAYRRALDLPMTLDLGSRRRRQDALRRAVGPKVLEGLKRHKGLIEALAEHAHEEFQDDRTPSQDQLVPLLHAVREEQKAGRLVFDDLGALFWELLDRYPSVEAAYRRRFPIIIADEHQDSSALQDAVVRRLFGSKLVVFADPMQLIHGFRGASETRLERHCRDCQEERTLSTAHRWHDSKHLGDWLLSVRRRLLGDESSCAAPGELTVRYTPRRRGFNAVKAEVKYAVGKAFHCNSESVAILVRTNQQVGQLRSYLCRENLQPRQIGSRDFEDARADIEQLPLFREPLEIASHALDRLRDLVPTLEPALAQARQRLGETDVDLMRAGTEAHLILEAIRVLYEGRRSRYFEGVVKVINAARARGHHVPRLEALRALERTADTLAGDAVELEEAVTHYAQHVLEATRAAPRTHRGLFVMTAHQAKGKEFDYVILADTSERFFPGDIDSRRLFYVAITRARKGWTVIAPDSAASPLLSALGC